MIVNMTKYNFLRLFRIFSLILIIDYPLLPISLSLLKKEPFCESNIEICLLSMILFFLIIALFWCVIWFMNYAVFFMDDYRSKNYKIKMGLTVAYVRYLQYSCRDKPMRMFFLSLLLLFVCLVVLAVLFAEIKGFLTQT